MARLIYESVLVVCLFGASLQQKLQNQSSPPTNNVLIKENNSKSRILYDYQTRIAAYKDIIESRCLLEFLKNGESLISQNFQKTRLDKLPKKIFMSENQLSKRQIWTLAGQRIVEFCRGFPTYLIQEVKPESQQNFFNIIPSNHNFNRRKKRSTKHYFVGRVRGQTQSQYLNIGNTEGKAEAESTYEGSKAVVTGSSGIGQAQSQSNPLDCGGCEGQVPGAEYDQQQALQFGRPGDISQIPGRYQKPGVQQPDQVVGPQGPITPQTGLYYRPGEGAGIITQPGQPGVDRYPAGPGQIPSPTGPQVSGYPGQIDQRVPGYTGITSTQPAQQTPSYSRTGQQIPGYPSSQLPGYPSSQLPGYPGQITGTQQIPGYPAQQILGTPGYPSTQIPGQRITTVPSQQGPGYAGQPVQQIPNQLIPGYPSVQLPGQQITGYPSHQVPGVAAQPGQQIIGAPGQQIPGYPSVQIPGQQITGAPGQQLLAPSVQPGQQLSGIPSQQVPGYAGLTPGYPGQQILVSPGQIAGVPSPGQQITSIPGQVTDYSGQQKPQAPGYPSYTGQIPGYSGQQIPGFAGQIPDRARQQIPGYPGQILSKPSDIQITSGLSTDQQRMDLDVGRIPISQESLAQTIPGRQSGRFGGRLAGDYDTNVGHRGKFSGVFSGQYEAYQRELQEKLTQQDQLSSGRLPGQVGAAPGQIGISRIPGQVGISQIPAQIGTSGIPGQYVATPSQTGIGGISGPTGVGGIPGQISYPGQVEVGYPTSTGQVGISTIPGQIGTGYPGYTTGISGTPGRDQLGVGPTGQIATGYPAQAGIGSISSQIGTTVPGQIGGIPGQIISGGIPGQVGFTDQAGVGRIPGQRVTEGIPPQFGAQIPGQIGYPSQNGVAGIPGQITAEGIPSQTGASVPGQIGYPGYTGVVGIPGQVTTEGIPSQSGVSAPGQIRYPSQVGIGYPGQVGAGAIPTQIITGGIPGQVGVPGQIGYPSQVGAIPGQIATVPGQAGVGYPTGTVQIDQYGRYISPTGTEQLIEGQTDDSDSQVQTSVQQVNNETQAMASAQGKYLGGTSQSEVSGTYSGSGSFSASAGSDDGKRGALTQVSGGKEGALSAAQGRGGLGQSQAQVQLTSETGDTTSSAQSGGHNHGTQTQVQASTKGGMADAQANGPGSTSSQAQIGFMPYDPNDVDDQSTPFRGGGMASAQGGSYSGQTQSQIQGKFLYGIKYTGAAQAGSGSKEALAARNQTQPSGLSGNFPTFKPLNLDFKKNPSSQSQQIAVPLSEQVRRMEDHNPQNARIENHKPLNAMTMENHKPQNVMMEHYKPQNAIMMEHYKPKTSSDVTSTRRDMKIENNNGDGEGVEDDDYDEEDYDEEEEAEKPLTKTISQNSKHQSQHIILDPLEDLDATVQQSSDGFPKDGTILQPGQNIPGSPGYKIPQGFRGRVKSTSGQNTYTIGKNSQAQSVTLTPGIGRIYYNKPVYAVSSKTQLRNGQFGYGSGYTYQPVQYQLKSGKALPNFVSHTKSETGSRDLVTGKKTPAVYYTQSSTCGVFTNTCVFNNSGKICIPKPKTNPDGTLMGC